MAGPIFPGEVFLQILRGVQCQSTLAAFSICSKQLHGLTENGGPLSCTGLNHGGPDRDFEKRLMSDSDIVKVVSSLPDLQKHLANKPCAGSWDEWDWPSLTALLLCLLPNLNTFKVHGATVLCLFRKIAKVVGLVISLQNTGKASQFAMKTLQHVCFENTVLDGFVSNLECYHIDNPSGWSWRIAAISFEHVTDLTIVGKMSHDSLHRLISFFPRLKCFEYSPGDAIESSRPSSIITVLLHHTETLEHLSITTDMPVLKHELSYLVVFKVLKSIKTTAHTWGLRAHVDPFVPRLLPNPLRSLTAKRLWTSLPENENFDFLPLSIKQVTFTSCAPGVFSLFYKCLCARRPPYLSKITLEFDRSSPVLSLLKEAAQRENWDEATKRKISISRYSNSSWAVIWDKEKDSNIWS